jgi:hypothetical protein
LVGEVIFTACSLELREDGGSCIDDDCGSGADCDDGDCCVIVGGFLGETTVLGSSFSA